MVSYFQCIKDSFKNLLKDIKEAIYYPYSTLRSPELSPWYFLSLITSFLFPILIIPLTFLSILSPIRCFGRQYVRNNLKKNPSLWKNEILTAIFEANNKKHTWVPKNENIEYYIEEKRISHFGFEYWTFNHTDFSELQIFPLDSWLLESEEIGMFHIPTILFDGVTNSKSQNYRNFLEFFTKASIDYVIKYSAKEIKELLVKDLKRSEWNKAVYYPFLPGKLGGRLILSQHDGSHRFGALNYYHTYLGEVTLLPVTLEIRMLKEELLIELIKNNWILFNQGENSIEFLTKSIVEENSDKFEFKGSYLILRKTPQNYFTLGYLLHKFPLIQEASGVFRFALKLQRSFKNFQDYFYHINPSIFKYFEKQTKKSRG